MAAKATAKTVVETALALVTEAFARLATALGMAAESAAAVRRSTAWRRSPELAVTRVAVTHAATGRTGTCIWKTLLRLKTRNLLHLPQRFP